MGKKQNKANLKLVASVFTVNDYSKGHEHNYDVFHDSDTDATILKYSSSKYWDDEIIGTAAAVLVDDGDQVEISIGDTAFSLDYSQMEELTALILACSQSDMEIREQKVTNRITYKTK